jgi:hypothetical protein
MEAMAGEILSSPMLPASYRESLAAWSWNAGKISRWYFASVPSSSPHIK